MIYGDDGIHEALEKLAGAQREAYTLVKPKILAALNARSPKEFRRAQEGFPELSPRLQRAMAEYGGGRGVLSSFSLGQRRSMRRGTEKMLNRKHRAKSGT